MTIINLQIRTIEALADDYARTRQKRDRPVSMSAAIRAIRTIAPETGYSDTELANIVAAAAVRHDHVIDFDGIASVEELPATL